MRSVRKTGKLIKRILRSNRDFACCISGGEGEGKTALETWLMICTDPAFRFLRNMIFLPTESEITKKIYNLKQYSCIGADEAMKALYKRNWNSKERKKLNVLFSRCRKKNLAIFFAIPNFWDLDPYYIGHRIRMWIYVVERGHALVFLKDDNPFTDDKWHRKDNMKTINRYTRGRAVIPTGLLVEAMKKTQNYAYEIYFPDLPPEIWEVYNELAMKFFKEEEETTDDEKTKALNLKIENAVVILSKKGWKRRMISTLFNMSVNAVTKILEKNDALPSKLKADESRVLDDAVKEIMDAQAVKVKEPEVMPSEVKVDMPDEQRNILKEVFG